MTGLARERLRASGAQRRLSPRARRRRISRRLGRLVLVAVLAAVAGFSAFIGGLLAAPASFDLPPAPKPALLFAGDGSTQIATIAPAERREPVPSSQIPEVMRQAMISAEDARFLAHNGVDPLATVRAVYRDLSGGRIQGGSTLTQQYVKNTYVGSDRTLVRKLREAALAVRLEKRLTKDEILVDYLNALYLGNGNYGVQAASKYYFDVPVRDLALDPRTGRRSAPLELARAALLAGIAPAPSVWNPVEDPRTAKARQQYTLNQMVLGGLITSDQASKAYDLKLKLARVTPAEGESRAPEFTDLLKVLVKEEYEKDRNDDELFRGGLRVRSTLDLDLQAALAEAMREVLPDDDDPQAAAVAIDISSGDVKAMSTLRRAPARRLPSGKRVKAVRGYERNGFNLATSGFRSSGSTIKPFTLAVALQQGHRLDEYRAAPACNAIPDPGSPGGVYRPCNAGDSGYSGSVTLRSALARSINTVYTPLAIEVGRARIKKLMIDSGVRARPGPGSFSTAPKSFGLGSTAEVSALSMANAYATLMNHGVHVPPRFFTQVRTGGSGTDRGRLVRSDPDRPKGTRALSADVADRVVEAMSAVATSAGTAPRAHQPFTVYGKTGTTNDSNDAWFIGCARSPYDLCVAVWMGHEYTECAGVVAGGACGGMEDVNGVSPVYGGTLPAEIFARTFQKLRRIQDERAHPERYAPSPSPSPSSSTTRSSTMRPSTTRR